LTWSICCRAQAINNAGMDAPTTPPPADGAARRAARLATPRLTRESDTLAAMLRIHCRDHHGPAAPDEHGLCPECSELLAYARKRLAGCPFGVDKPTCANCQVHCYGPRQREAVRAVMRHAGPRMLLRHPVLALAHLLVDGRRPAPPKPRGAAVAGSAVNDDKRTAP
jgi:Nitrous oxide-stimulated promoter